MDSDFLLIRKIRQGEEEACSLFVRKYYKEILSYCGYRCPDRECAEDITQETFARFFAKLPDYQHLGKAKNYLYTIAGNLCRDYYRKIKEFPVEESELTAHMESAEHPMEHVLDRLAVAWALKQLPHELSEVVTLYYFQELKLTEIAAILHIGLPLVKYRLKQAKAKLRRLIEEGSKCEAFLSLLPDDLPPNQR